MNFEKVQNWEPYDSINSFRRCDAALLWFGLEPPAKFEEDQTPLYVRQLLCEIPQTPFDERTVLQNLLSKPCYDRVSRDELLNLARERREKPDFLYPEARNQKPKGLNPRTRKVYLRIIAGLLEKLRQDNPSDSFLAPDIRKIIELTGESVSDNKIRDVLKELETDI